jgi:hypothetical protein
VNCITKAKFCIHQALAPLMMNHEVRSSPRKMASSPRKVISGQPEVRSSPRKVATIEELENLLCSPAKPLPVLPTRSPRDGQNNSFR